MHRPLERSRPAAGIAALFLLLLAPLTAAAEPSKKPPAPAADWANWRGPLHTGVAPTGEPPITWAETKNVRFKVEVPGRGHASPIVHGDQIFLLTAVPAAAQPAPPPTEDDDDDGPDAAPPAKQRFLVLSYNRNDGKLLWQQTAAERLPHEGHHLDASFASASPVTDGKRLIAHFGSSGTYAYDLGGKLLWSVDLGDMATRRGFGEGSSPALADDTVIVNWDHEGDSFIVALDAATGKERWKVTRAGEATSWSTPLVVEHGGRKQVVVSATGKSRGYDLATGKELWSIGGMTANAIPTPVELDGVVFLMSGFRGNMLQAISLEHAKGEVEGTDALLWSHDRHTPYVPSPLLYDGKLYFLKSNSDILTNLDAKTGRVVYTEQRIPGIENVYASPVGAAGRIYFFDRGGHGVVLKHGDGFEVLAENELAEGVDASPAIVGPDLFVRTTSHLYCLRQEAAAGAAASSASGR